MFSVEYICIFSTKMGEYKKFAPFDSRDKPLRCTGDKKG